MHSEEQQHDDLVDSPPPHTTPVLSQEDFHPELSSSYSIPYDQQITPCDPVPPQAIITNPSSSSNTTILVGDTTVNDIVISSIPTFNTNKSNENKDDDIAGDVSHATPSAADLTDELTICRSGIFDLEKSIKALKSETEEYQESLKYQSEEIKLLRKTYPDSSTLRSHQDHREDGCIEGWGMNPFEEYYGIMGWGGKNVDHHKENLQKIIIFDDPPQELIYETEKSPERSSENDLASMKVKNMKRDIHNLKMRVEMLQKEKNEKYWKDRRSPFQAEEEVSETPEEGEDDDLGTKYFDDQHDDANDSLRLEQALLQEKQDHLRTLSKIEEILHLKNKEIRELNDKLSDQQGLVAEMLDTNGSLTQRISELEKQFEDDHRLRMEQRSDDARRYREERLTGEVRAGVAGRTSEVFDAGLTDVSEDEKGSEPKYCGW